MNILVIDGQGGGVGRQLVENIKRAFPDQTVTAVGTNVLATQAMLRAGADRAATGEMPQGGCDCGAGGDRHSGFPVGRDHAQDGGGSGAE